MASASLVVGEVPSRLLDWPSEEFHFDLPGGKVRTVRWGQPWQFLTAAYWASRAQEWLAGKPAEPRPYRLAGSLSEEIVACLLGGHGITYEMNVAAFAALKKAGLLNDADPRLEDRIASVLRAPLLIGDRRVHYRYPQQRSGRVAAALQRLRRESAPAVATEARSWLMTFSGIGPKTASWVVRNQFEDSNVAIIDIHVHRAAVHAGVFDESWTPARDYWVMESAFLEWARYGEVRAADLDAVIWQDQALAARVKMSVGAS